MSFTGTGLEVRTRGGSLGGLTMSLMFSIKDLYHGSSISGGSRCARWSLGSGKRLFGCDRSAMFVHQLPLWRTAVYALLFDDGRGQVVTAFGNSAPRILTAILPQPYHRQPVNSAT